MSYLNGKLRWWACALAVCLPGAWAIAQEAPTRPSKVYVPYEKLKGVFETEKQGVFLPYTEFQRLWRLAAGAPAEVLKAPAPHLISTARFSGKVGEEVARLQLELTVDILVDGWIEAPIGLGNVAVVSATFAGAEGAKARPLLRVVDGQYKLVTKGKGRRVLKVDFVCQLVSQPGLKVLSFRMPPAAISTLELLIPEENMKVDVEPMLAATASQVEAEGKRATKLQAFLGAAKQVKLSWKPKTQAAAELEPVVIAQQLQHIHVAEALISHEVTFTLDIRRRGVDAFSIQLPGDFRVTSVEGANISKWDLAAKASPAGKPAVQNLQVKLFSPAKDAYALTIKMERFLKDPKVQIPLSPIVLQQALRRTGLVAITRSPRRAVEVTKLRNLARVDTGRLPANLRKRAGVTAYRFITADYGATLAIAAVAPRITVNQLWALGVRPDRLELRGRLNYKIDRAGLFQLTMNLPEPWEVLSLEPANIVDDHQLTGSGAKRTLTILLKRELTGSFHLDLSCRAPRAKRDADVDFALPLADAQHVQLYSGQLLLFLADQFRAEIARLDQLQSLPLSRASPWTRFSGLSTAMAFEFRAADRAKPAGATFRIAVKPAQVSAVVHRLVNIEPGSIDQEAVIEYRIRYAPVDTFYVTMPAAMADAGVQISGANIKEKPRIDSLPVDQRPATTPPATQPAVKWAYYKVVLQSPVIGSYRLYVRVRRSFQAGEAGKTTTVVVEPILAAGKLSDQSGHVAIAKADTLAIGEPTSRNLKQADAGSPTDVPYAPHRKRAFLAFKYSAPPFELSLPVVTQKEAAVFATIVTGAVVEQVLARDGKLNAHVVYLLATSRGDRLPIVLPAGADLFAVLLNGAEAPVEAAAEPNKRIVRLPPSAGQVTKFVLEISYGLGEASAGNLAAPQLPEGVPVQQTLWRVWVPQEDYVLGYDRDFSPLKPREANSMIATLGRGQPSQVAFKLPPQGKQLNFIRQGSPGTLSVMVADKEVFGIVLWVVILAAGVAMLKLAGFHRCLIVLGVVVVGFIVRMFAPLLIEHIYLLGVWAAAIVALLWLAHWLLVARPAVTRASRPPAPKAQPAPEVPSTPEPPPTEQPPAAGQADTGAKEE